MGAGGVGVIGAGTLESPDQAGTAPGDRRFRPDVEGLRAVAVLLVVLFHAGVPGIHGGYVGVDVFFVISGFVITGLLLRERASTGGTSILDFYARRARRILPAATLVIVHHRGGQLTSPSGRSAVPRWPTTGGGPPSSSRTSTSRPSAPTTSRPPSPVPPAELLVAVGRGAVLPGLPHAVPADGPGRGAAVAAGPDGRRLRRGDRRVVHAVGGADGHAPVRRLLLPVHPGLGAGARRAGGRRDHLAAAGARPHRGRAHLGGVGADRRGGGRLQRPDPLSGGAGRRARYSVPA